MDLEAFLINKLKFQQENKSVNKVKPIRRVQIKIIGSSNQKLRTSIQA